MIENRVFWVDEIGHPFTKLFSTENCQNPLTESLQFANELRKDGAEHVIISTVDSNQVGKMGVDAVVDGKLPDGSDYTWKMRRI